MGSSVAGSPNAFTMGPRSAGMPSGTGKGSGAGGGMSALPTALPAAMPATSNPAYAPLPQPSGFNVNRAAASGLQGAIRGTQEAMGYQPQQVSTFGYQPQQVSGSNYAASQMGPAGQVAGADLGAYTNPYETQVVEQSLSDLERSRLMQQNQLGAQASAAGAFGGSRQGVAEAETNRAFAEQAARTASGLRQSGYQQAQQLAGQDIGRQMQVDAANQAALNAQRQFGAQQSMAAKQMNQSAALQAAQMGMTAQQLNQAAGLQGAQFRLGAAGQMGNLGQQAFGTSQAIQQQQMQQGLMQQGLQQQLIDAARGQYAGAVGAPQQSLGLPLAALGATPVPQSTTQSMKPGLFNYLQLGAQAMCWVAREVYGEDDPKWLQFREWVIGYSPNWFYKAYSKYGEKVAKVVAKVPALKLVIRPFMDAKRKAMGYK